MPHYGDTSGVPAGAAVCGLRWASVPRRGEPFLWRRAGRASAAGSRMVDGRPGLSLPTILLLGDLGSFGDAALTGVFNRGPTGCSGNSSRMCPGRPSAKAAAEPGLCWNVVGEREQHRSVIRHPAVDGDGVMS